MTEPQADFFDLLWRAVHGAPPESLCGNAGQPLDEQDVRCWLVNTGWQGGRYGVGKRMHPALHARDGRGIALAGKLDNVEDRQRSDSSASRLPQAVPGVPNEVLNPRDTWADKAAYDKQAKDLAKRFTENFKKYADGTSDAIKNAGPKA